MRGSSTFGPDYLPSERASPTGAPLSAAAKARALRRSAVRHEFPLASRGRWSVLLVFLASFGGCGASCKKGPDTVTSDEAPPIVDLPGVDTSSLILSEKRTFSKVVHEYMSPCGDPVTLEVCVRETRACNRCVPAARAIARMVPKGEGETEIREWLDNRFDDKAVKSIDLSGSPSRGPSDAPIVLVEFADFECPHCGDAAPILDSVTGEPEFRPKVRFVFKNFPLSAHEHAEAAARASVAAQDQGKFWEMHDELFTHQQTLGQADIEGYAKKLGLDMEKFKSASNSVEVKDRVNRDREQGTKLGVAGTPTMFINGRRFMQAGHADFADQLRDWMRLESALASGGGRSPAPVPSPASSRPGPT